MPLSWGSIKLKGSENEWNIISKRKITKGTTMFQNLSNKKFNRIAAKIEDEIGGLLLSIDTTISLPEIISLIDSKAFIHLTLYDRDVTEDNIEAILEKDHRHLLSLKDGIQLITYHSLKNDAIYILHSLTSINYSAGRPKLSEDEKRKLRSIKLRNDDYNFLHNVGKGSYSKGIEKLIEVYKNGQ